MRMLLRPANSMRVRKMAGRQSVENTKERTSSGVSAWPTWEEGRQQGRIW